MRLRFSNARVWQQDGSFATQLTLEDGIVVANEAPVAEEIDCNGGAIWPAFVDAHAHPFLAGRELHGVNLDSCDGIDEIVRRLTRWLEENPNFDGWLVAGAYDRSLAPGGRFRKEWLDQVSSKIPIVLHANDHHSIWVNSAALSESGLDNVPSELLDFIDNENGTPTGVLRESHAKDLVLRELPPNPIADAEGLVLAHKKLASLGVIAVIEAWADEPTIAAYQRVLESGESDSLLRTDIAYWIQPHNWESDIALALKHQSQFASYKKGPGVRLSQAKYFIDGVFGSATAAVREEYCSGGNGQTVWRPQDLESSIAFAVKTGLKPHLHAIGDAAVDISLDALETVAATSGEFSATIVHAELLHDDQIRRIANGGWQVNLQPLWGRPDAMWRSSKEQLGERANDLYRARSLLESGVQLAFGSDWPVSDPNPLLGLFTAVFRSLPGNPEARQNPNQSITLEHALEAYTSAGQSQLSVELGGLKIGEKASFVRLDIDPSTRGLESLAQAKVLETFSGGRRIFARH